MEIKFVNNLSSEQYNYLFNWKNPVFSIEGQNVIWAKSTSHLLAFDQSDKPIAHLGYGRFPIYIKGQGMTYVVGVGGIVVRPEAQGNGIPGQLFNFLHNSAHALDISKTFTLFCTKSLAEYYQKHGYILFEGEFSFLQNGVPSTNENFVFMYRGEPLTVDKIEIQSEPW